MIRDAKKNKNDDKKKSLIIHFTNHRWNIKTLWQFFDIIYLCFVVVVLDMKIFSRRTNTEQVNDSSQMWMKKWKWSHSVMSDLAIPWTAAYQAPPSMGFPGKSAAVDCHFLLQGIFPTQELNPALLHCRQMLYRLSHQGSYCGTIPLAGSHCDLVIAGKSFTLLISIFINSWQRLSQCV